MCPLCPRVFPASSILSQMLQHGGRDIHRERPGIALQLRYFAAIDPWIRGSLRDCRSATQGRPRMMTNITGCAQTPEALRLDMPLEVAFAKQNEEITLPLFKPSEA